MKKNKRCHSDNSFNHLEEGGKSGTFIELSSSFLIRLSPICPSPSCRERISTSAKIVYFLIGKVSRLQIRSVFVLPLTTKR